MFEAKLTELCSQIWVIACTKDQQLERLIARDSLAIHEAKKRIQAQFSLAKKSQLADVIIDNTGGLNAWRNQVEKYLKDS